MSKKLAIIPARGGSKRIPRKNIKNFQGKPIISYSIEAALRAGIFDEVMVSTDDSEIAEVARMYGASVPFIRSEKNADDFAATDAVVIEVLADYQEKLSTRFETGCCIYPTVPLINPKTLIESGEVFHNNKFDTLYPIVKFGFPILRAVQVKDNKIVLAWPEYEQVRSQDIPPYYHDAGQYYWFRSDYLLEYKTSSSKNTGYIELSELEIQDIDNEADWVLAELKFEYLRRNAKIAP